MLKERDQRRSNRYDLTWTDIHITDVSRGGERELVLMAHCNEILDKPAVFVKLGISLSNNILALLDRRQVINLRRNFAVLDLPVRCLKEAVLVGTGINRQRIYQTDIWTFRRFDRAHAAIVSRMDVAHLEARTLTRQATRTECGHAAFVSDFRQRIVLIHELR